MTSALAAHDVVVVRAANPGPLTLSGTNTWIVGRGPCWVVDPGPALDDHVAAVAGEVARRGGLGGIALTHDHADHAEAVAPLRAAAGRAPLAAARGEADLRLADGATAGPLRAVATPGHAPDHLAFVVGHGGGAGDAGEGLLALTGDAVLGEGSVFVAPGPGSLRGYLDGLARLRALPLDVIGPGHGPVVTDPAAKLDGYLAHRAERERRLLAALDDGRRGGDELLDAAWAEVPPALRPAAAVTLAAHLDKLEEEGRLPAGVERPAWPAPVGEA